MIGFLNGLILPALFAAAIPLILHFFSRNKAKRLLFSSLLFLRAIESQRIKQVKLYQILLIVVRILFIIFLVLAFSRPTLKSSNLGGTGQTTSAVFIIDNSYSMQAFHGSESYFELAIKRAMQMQSLFSPEDKLFFLLGNKAYPVDLQSATPFSFLKNQSASFSTFNAKQAWAITDSLLQVHNSVNKEIYLFSDFRIKKEAINAQKLAQNIPIYAIQLTTEDHFVNCSVDTAYIENPIIEEGEEITVQITVRNHHLNENRIVNLHVYDGENRVGMANLTIDAQRSVKHQFHYKPQGVGNHNITIQVEEDDLSVDNFYYLTFELKPEINVLYVSNSQSLNPILELLGKNTLLNFKTTSYNQWNGLIFTDFDALILQGPVLLNTYSKEKLLKFIATEKALILLPEIDQNAQPYNLFFSALNLPFKFSSVKQASKGGFFPLTSNSGNNPIYKALFKKINPRFSAPILFRYWQLKQGSKQLINLENNDPFLLQHNNTLLFTTNFAKENSSFKLSPLFLPLLYRTFVYATHNNNSQPAYTVGDAINFALLQNKNSNNFTLKTPTHSTSIIPLPQNNRFLFNNITNNRPGFYQLLSNKKVVQVKSSNHSNKEILAVLATKELEANSLNVLKKNDDISTIKNRRLGTEIWYLFALLSLLMLLTEMVLIKKIDGTPFFANNASFRTDL